MKTTNSILNILNSWFDKSPKKPEICDIRKNKLWLYYEDSINFINLLKEYDIKILEIQTYTYKAKNDKELDLSYDFCRNYDYEIVKSRLNNSAYDKDNIFMYKKFLLLDSMARAGYITLFSVIPNLSNNINSVIDNLNLWFNKSPKIYKEKDITKCELWLYYEDGLSFLGLLEENNIKVLGCEALLFYPDKKGVEPNQYHSFSLEHYPLVNKNLTWYPKEEKSKYDTCRNFFYDRFEIVKELRKIGYDMLFQTELDLSIAKID